MVYKPKDKIPVAVAYKKQSGTRVWIKEFKDLGYPDQLISSRTKLLPKDCTILDIGVGKKFYEIYKKRYA